MSSMVLDKAKQDAKAPWENSSVARRFVKKNAKKISVNKDFYPRKSMITKLGNT
jgi:hypothetical protein